MKKADIISRMAEGAGITKEMGKEVYSECVDKTNCQQIIIDEGNIYIIVSISLSPFFEESIERKFYEVRLSEQWGRYVGFGEGKETLLSRIKNEKDGNGFFSYDTDERILEEFGYDIEAFRGVVFNELFTPIYKLEKDLTYLIENFLHNIDKDVFYKVKENLRGWKIRIKITKGGLANIFLEKKVDNHKDIKDYAIETMKLMENPWKSDNTKNLVNNQKSSPRGQIFTSYLDLVAIFITHILLKKYDVSRKVADILKQDFVRNEELLKYPLDVRYVSIASFTGDSPPLRNYCVVYYFRGVKGREGIDIHGNEINSIYIEDHFDCPEDPSTCNLRQQDKCFIKKYGHSLLLLSTCHSLLSLSTCSQIEKIRFTQKEVEKIAKRDLARSKGMFCLVESETVIICTPKESVVFNIDYWRCIIKGFSLLLGCKTMAEIMVRLLLECIWNYRHNKIDIKEVQRELIVISNLLSRTRLTTTSSNIARATFVRDTYDEYIKAIGLSQILNNIEKDYSEINEGVISSIEGQRSDSIKTLTSWLIPLTLPITVGTIMLVMYESDSFLLEEFSKLFEEWKLPHKIYDFLIAFILTILLFLIGPLVFKYFEKRSP